MEALPDRGLPFTKQLLLWCVSMREKNKNAATTVQVMSPGVIAACEPRSHSPRSSIHSLTYTLTPPRPPQHRFEETLIPAATIALHPVSISRPSSPPCPPSFHSSSLDYFHPCPPLYSTSPTLM